jgi:hypothetical protein
MTHMALGSFLLEQYSYQQAFPPPAEQFLLETLAADYQALGPWTFFFAGLPSELAGWFLRPAWLAPNACYWTLRLILANVSSVSKRTFLLSQVPLISNV